MITVSIVEDDKKAAESLSNYLQRYGTSNNIHFQIKTYEDGLSFLDNYQSCDLVFMDIEMPLQNGMITAEKLRKIDERVVLVFVTNMAQYAIKGYSVNALDFIVKPISYSDFSFKLKRAIYAIESNQNDEVVITGTNEFQRFRTNNICYIEIHGHTLTYHLESKEFSVRGSLSETAAKFPNFIRCNNCYLVNPAHIDWVKGFEVKVGNDILAISRPRRKEFLEQLSIWYSKGGL
ncbi:MAG: LytTR family DNA-binding domain-containing protein [Lachnospiraceae bacterium]|nr:LytTR family DNA-binding domain-containing protein [Lachnospiraceae bacterium]